MFDIIFYKFSNVDAHYVGMYMKFASSAAIEFENIFLGSSSMENEAYKGDENTMRFSCLLSVFNLTVSKFLGNIGYMG